MTSTIITKNSAVAGLAPSAGQLVQGELAVNVTDKKIYTLDDNGNVVLLSLGTDIDLPVVIDVSSASDALRITQRGSGNALLVEDSTNPDSTPFVVTNNGSVGIGVTSPTAKLDVNGSIYSTGDVTFLGELQFENSFISQRSDGHSWYLQTDNTDRLVINENGAWRLGGGSYGTVGQLLQSNGDADPSWETQYLAIPFIVDGGGNTFATGIKGDLQIPFDCEIEEWTILLDATGSIEFDIWKDTYANYPPTVADSITGSAKPTVTTAVKATSDVLTGWTTTISAGDILRFNVDSVTSATRATLSLKVKRV